MFMSPPRRDPVIRLEDAWEEELDGRFDVDPGEIDGRTYMLELRRNGLPAVIAVLEELEAEMSGTGATP